MILEGILTTEADDGSLHVAPIGPHVDFELEHWTLKPFQTSRTFAHLRAKSRAVFHVIDDSLLMAQSVLGLPIPPDAACFESDLGWVLVDACRLFALRIDRWDMASERAVASCRVTHRRELRPAWGWNRAANSILELSILASRRHMTRPEVVQAELERHAVIIGKTAGERELQAWELLKEALSQ